MTIQVTMKFSGGGEAMLRLEVTPREFISKLKTAVAAERGILDIPEENGETKLLNINAMTTCTIRKV